MPPDLTSTSECRKPLLKLASFALTRDQSDLVGRLTRWIYWAGRYPVPKNSNDSAVDFSQKLNLHNASDPAAIDLLFASLQAIYVAEQTAREEKWTALSESRPKAGPQELLRLDAAVKQVAEDAAEFATL